ncbi:MAG: hypothetical protein WC455_19730 [Dehalococcoidia bacterium]|jgi:hypothetical protein
MSFIVKGGGPVNWSAVTIDADKNMLGFGMSNMKQVVAAMVGGDLVAKGLGGVLVRIPAGIANTVLTSAGVGLVPTWAPGGLYLNRYFPVVISDTLTTLIKATPDATNNKNAPITRAHVNVYQDTPASYVKRVDPAITDTLAGSAAAPDATDNHNAPAHTHFDLTKVVDGAVADDGGVQTTETAAAQNATANDMTLLPAVPAGNDAYYFGLGHLWDYLTLNIGTQGNGVWTITWEYYDVDTTWHALAGVTDNTTHFRAAVGNKTVLFTRPAGWALTNVNAAGNMYWIRARVSAYTSVVTQPKGTQAWCTVIT